MKLSSPLLFALFFFAGAQAQTLVKPIQDIDAYVDRVRKTFDVPGIAVAIVKDGKIVSAKGYGIRQMGRTEIVDSHTLFGIASNTKAFTATALGLLVEEGKIDWDTPVIQYLPWFQLSDPYVTHEITVRDLLVHRSGLGLGSGDLLAWPASTYTRKEVARQIKFLPLVKSFRSAYAYDNALYTIAGELIEEVSGQPWEQFITSRILAKVGMKESTVHYTGPVAGSAGSSEQKIGVNVAIPHARVGEKVQPVAPYVSDNFNPAGGINSSAEDMAKWLIVQLDSGKLSSGERLFARSTSKQLWSTVTPLPIGEPPIELAPLRANFSGYGLGFFIRDYRGKKLVTHTGGLPGYVSKVAMIPELKLGVVILTNQESGAAFESIAYHVLDYYLGVPTYDWIGNFEKVVKRGEAAIATADAKASGERNSKSVPSLPLDAYAGVYHDQWYGDITVKKVGAKLQIQFMHTPSLIGDLEHWQYDTFVARWYDRELRADAFVTFSLRPDGTIDHAKMEAVSDATDFSFDFQDLTLIPKR
jgi:CubicO group peptidase (beta-lactamase class C family)